MPHNWIGSCVDCGATTTGSRGYCTPCANRIKAFIGACVGAVAAIRLRGIRPIADWTADERESAVRRYVDGETIAELARNTDLSVQAIRDFMRRLGLPSHPRGRRRLDDRWQASLTPAQLKSVVNAARDYAVRLRYENYPPQWSALHPSGDRTHGAFRTVGSR